jgi:hypothetical protein
MLRRAFAGLAVIATAFASIACERSAPPVPKTRPAIVDTARTIAQGDSALHFPILPDTAKTPGAILDVRAADICVPGYSKKVRNVPAAVKRQAYALYGVRTHEPGEYEVDHLISLELGGSNSIRNLWPQSFRTHPWNARVKDALENELHRRVCAGTMQLATAQQVIAHNWVIGYRIYVHQNPPPPKTRASTRTTKGEQQRPRPEPRPEAPVP